MILISLSTRMIGLSDGEDRAILAGFVQAQYQRVTDRQTDGQKCYGYRALYSTSAL